MEPRLVRACDFLSLRNYESLSRVFIRDDADGVMVPSTAMPCVNSPKTFAGVFAAYLHRHFVSANKPFCLLYLQSWSIQFELLYQSEFSSPRRGSASVDCLTWIARCKVSTELAIGANSCRYDISRAVQPNIRLK